MGKKTMSAVIALFALGGSFAFLYGDHVRPARAGEPRVTVLTGTGTSTSGGPRIATVLDPPCVSLVNRDGPSTYAGLITGTGSASIRSLLDRCGPAQGNFLATIVLDHATIGGRTGSVELRAEGTFEGEVGVEPGTRTRMKLSLRGLRGALAGARGEGVAVGLAQSYTPDFPASSTTYYLEVHLPNE
jgi:hypothetical protein